MSNACFTELEKEEYVGNFKKDRTGTVSILDLEKFYNCYSPRLRNVALRILKNPDLAEDAVQDAFINIFRFIKDFRGESSIETWMTKIVTNICLGYIRKNRGGISTLNQNGMEGQVKENFFRDKDSTPIDVIYKKELSEYVHNALKKLRKVHRDVLILHDFSYKTIAEIASQEGIPEGTVKSRLFYARKELKSFLSSLFTRQACQPI